MKTKHDEVAYSRVGEHDEGRHRRRSSWVLLAGVLFGLVFVTGVVVGAFASRLFHSSAKVDVEETVEEEVPEKIRVCVKADPLNPRHASLFLGSTLEPFLKKISFRVDPSIWRAARYGLHKDLKSTPREECQASDPVVWLLNAYHKEPKGSRLAKIVVADEACHCRRTICGGPDGGLMRQYHMSRFATGDNDQKIADHWLPLGPRFEFDRVSEEERSVPPSSRGVTFNFVGSATNPDRQKIENMWHSAGNAKHYPSWSKGFVRTTETWGKSPGKAPGMLNPKQFRKLLLDSTFTLAVRGHNYETYRLFEAIEAGSIPVIETGTKYDEIQGSCSGSFKPLLDSNPPFLFVQTWLEVPQLLENEFKDPEALDRRHAALLEWRKRFWENRTRLLEDYILEKINAF